MFKIVALVYILFAGQPVDEPLSFDSQVTFDSLEKCQEVMKSPTFAAQRAGLQQMIHELVIAKQDAELAAAVRDNKEVEPPPAPSVAVTTSCQEDNRL